MRAETLESQTVTTSTPLDDFSVSVSFATGRIILAIRGELDICTVPPLRSLLDAIIDDGHKNVVLDLASLDFLDASGLNFMDRAMRRLRGADGALSLRSASASVRRVLAITKLDQVIPSIS